MNLKHKYSAVIALIVDIVYDVLVFVIKGDTVYDRQFWLAFMIVQFMFAAFIIFKLFEKDDPEERGIKIIDFSMALGIFVSVFMSIIAYVIPTTTNSMRILTVFYLIFACILAVLVVFSFVYRHNVKRFTAENRLFVSSEDIVETLIDINDLLSNQKVKDQIEKLITFFKEYPVDLTTTRGQQVEQYVKFMYKNAYRKELVNLCNNLNKLNEILAKK